MFRPRFSSAFAREEEGTSVHRLAWEGREELAFRQPLACIVVILIFIFLCFLCLFILLKLCSLHCISSTNFITEAQEPGHS